MQSDGDGLLLSYSDPTVIQSSQVTLLFIDKSADRKKQMETSLVVLKMPVLHVMPGGF